MVLENFYNRKQIGILPIDNVNFTYLSIAFVIIFLILAFGIFTALKNMEKANVKNKNTALQDLANAEKAKYEFEGQQKFNKVCYEDDILNKYIPVMINTKKSIQDFISTSKHNPSYILFCEEAQDKLNKEEQARNKLLQTLIQGPEMTYSTELEQYKVTVLELNHIFSNVLTLSIDNNNKMISSEPQTINIDDI
jgi:hypothetical protein